MALTFPQEEQVAGGSTRELEDKRLARKLALERHRARQQEKIRQYAQEQARAISSTLPRVMPERTEEGQKETVLEKDAAIASERRRGYLATIRQARSLVKQSRSGLLSGAEEKAAFQAMRMATGKVLMTAWLNIPSTLGLSLIYINLHFFLHYLPPVPEFKDIFCPFGSEWKGSGELAATVALTAATGGAGGAAAVAAKAGTTLAKEAGKKTAEQATRQVAKQAAKKASAGKGAGAAQMTNKILEVGEIIVLLLLDLCLFTFLLIIAFFVIVIADIFYKISHPWELIKDLWGGLKLIYDLLKA